MGSPLATTLMARGLGYLIGSNTAQQAVPPQQVVVAPPYTPYPMQGIPAASSEAVSSTDYGLLAQLQLLGELHDAGYLTDEEFAREKQRLLRN